MGEDVGRGKLGLKREQVGKNGQKCKDGAYVISIR